MYKQCKPAPFLEKEHHIVRVNWACSKLKEIDLYWKIVTFTDEKELDLSTYLVLMD